jgi:hypothetical protein
MVSMLSWRKLSDEQLLKQCRFEAFRGPGPGGQKRNKTSSAVRLVHAPSGIAVLAGESRSQHQNRAAALRRMRHAIAVQIRHPFDAALWESKNLDVSRRAEHYPAVIGAVLDALAEENWSVSRAAEKLGVSTGQLVKFLKSDEKVWTELSRQRKKLNLRSLI